MELSLSPTSIIGDYRLIQPLGEGGMGSVWLAEHVVLGKRFAIKLLLSEIANNVELRARFEQEARTIGRLDHPNVVSATHFGLTPDGQPYLVMEALRGQSVGALLEQIQVATGRPMPAVRAIALIRQACMGIAHAHEHGIVHRDLKPDNLFVTQTITGADLVKVLDFGIAKIRGDAIPIGHKTRTGVVLGTPYYMSCEQARGESDIDFRTDIYSLAAILYEMVAGRKPHDGAQYNALLADIITRDPAPLDERSLELPRGLSQVLLRGMSRDRDNRYQTVAEFEQVLGALVDAFRLTPAHVSGQVFDSAKLVNTVIVPTPVDVSSVSPQSVPKSISTRGAGRFGPVTTTVRNRATWFAFTAGLALLAIGVFAWNHWRQSFVARAFEPSNEGAAIAVRAAGIVENATGVRLVASGAVNSEASVPGEVQVTPIASIAASTQPVASVGPPMNSPIDVRHRSDVTLQKTALPTTIASASERKTVRVSEPPATPVTRKPASVTIRVPRNPYQ